MFTVGYGDILPINNVEILVILLIQFLGIFFFTKVLSSVDIFSIKLVIFWLKSDRLKMTSSKIYKMLMLSVEIINLEVS